jgi:hypothetical protein
MKIVTEKSLKFIIISGKSSSLKFTFKHYEKKTSIVRNIYMTIINMKIALWMMVTNKLNEFSVFYEILNQSFISSLERDFVK